MLLQLYEMKPDGRECKSDRSKIAMLFSWQAIEHGHDDLGCGPTFREWKQWIECQMSQIQKNFTAYLPQLDDFIGKAYSFNFLSRWLTRLSPQQWRRRKLRPLKQCQDTGPDSQILFFVLVLTLELVPY